MTLHNSQPNPNDPRKTYQRGGPKHISELISAALSLRGAALPGAPDIERFQSPAAHQGFRTADEIRKLFNTGEVEQAIEEARNLYDVRASTFSPNAQVTLTALGSLLEYATRARSSLPDLHERLYDLQQYFQGILPGPEVRSADDADSRDVSSQGVALNRFDIMHTLPRLCEYLAQTGRKDPSLRGLAESSLEQLHKVYPLFCGEGERLTLKQDAASATIRAAAHVAAWKVQEESSDLRSLEYIAECGRDRLEQFTAPLAQHTFALFQLESRQIEAGLKTLEHLIESPQGVDIDIRIASLDQVTGWYIRLNRLDSARASLSSLREALARDGANDASAMKGNPRVRAQEALRVQSYEKMLSAAEQG